jgi:hypothetical protein
LKKWKGGRKAEKAEKEKGDDGEILTFFRYADMSAVCQGKPV